MDPEDLNTLAVETAEALKAEWLIGDLEEIPFEPGEFKIVSTEELAEKLKPFLLRAFKTTRSFADGL